MHAASKGEKIELQFSRYDYVLFGLVHGTIWMLFMVSFVTGPAWLVLVPLALWLAWRHYIYLRDGLLWLIPPDETCRHWELCSRQGEWHAARLSSVFIHPWLLVLDFGLTQGSHRLLIWPDSLKPEQSRLLRCICAIVTDSDYLSTMKDYSSKNHAPVLEHPTDPR